MAKDYSSLPINASFDTNILLNIFFGETTEDSDIIRMNDIKENNPQVVARTSAKNSLKTLLSNYCCIKFFRHLMKNQKLNLMITPTAYSEISYSYFITDILMDLLKENNYNIFKFITVQEYNQILNHYNSKKPLYQSTIANISNFSNFKPYDNSTLVSRIQNAIFRRIKEKFFEANLINYTDSVEFLHIPGNTNPLRDTIYQLSESYLIDRKRTSDNKHIDGDFIPQLEVNDSTIMATCALLNIPLISADSKALSSKIEIYHEENKLINKRNPNSPLLALGEPFSPKDFILRFYKDEFLSFIKDFEIPQDILDIDDEDIIQDTINYITNTPVPLFGENPNKSSKLTDEEKLTKNRERYNQSFDNNRSLADVKFLTTNDCFSQIHSDYVSTASKAVTHRREVMHAIQAQILTNEIDVFEKKFEELENAFWGITKREGNTFTPSKKNDVNLLNISTLSTDCFYQLLVVVNHILKHSLYGFKQSDIPNEITDFLNKHNFNCIYDSNSYICGIAMDGIIFKINEHPNQGSNNSSISIGYNPAQQRDEEKRMHNRLQVEYNVDQLSDKTALLLGTSSFSSYRPYTFCKILNTYMSNFREKHSNFFRAYECRNRYSAEDVRNFINTELSSLQNLGQKKRSDQIDQLMYNISMEKV